MQIKDLHPQMQLLVYRLISKAIDFFLVMIMHAYFEHVFSTLLALAYMLCADGFFQGQSIGKRIVGLKVSYLDDNQSIPCPFMQSAIRNAPFALILLLSTIPILGRLFELLGVVFIAIEIYFMYSDEEGIRIGDIYAKTKVTL